MTSIVLILGLLGRTRAEPAEERLRLTQVVTELPQTAWETLKFSFRRDGVPVWAGLVASTAVLYHYDRDLDRWAKGQGRRWGLTSENNIRTVVSLGPHPLFRVPTDGGSALYFLGDGWTQFSIAGGFLIAGAFDDHARAWNTGLQIVHGITVAQILNQFLKHTTGRESPFVATAKRGRWDPFPNQIEYGKHTPSYDAFPSGHVMTATLVFNTIRLNYPAQEAWLLPLEIAWDLGLMFQMMNNGVHWASDYPLGLAMGWAVARMSHDMAHPERHRARAGTAWSISPDLGVDGQAMLTARRGF